MSRSVFRSTSRHLYYIKNIKLCSISHKNYYSVTSLKNSLNSNHVCPRTMYHFKCTDKFPRNIDYKQFCISTLQMSNLRNSMTAEQESRLTQIASKSDNSDLSEVKTSTP